ncbi:MAG: SDR family oxidoreductase [Pseudomonadota bacterium]
MSGDGITGNGMGDGGMTKLKGTEGGTALVTGASSGIGAAVVRQLTGSGRKVVAVARRADRLAALADETGCRVETLDMRDFPRAVAFTSELKPDVLVNNAGSGHGFLGVQSASDEDLTVAVETNVLAPLFLLKAALPAMVAAQRGHIVNIGSIAGLYPIVSAVYGGTKGAIHLTSQNLRHELKGTGVRVTEIAPGRVATEFYDASNIPEETAAKIKDTGIEELTPDDVASAVLFALDAPARMNVSLIELTPTEQTPGGIAIVPAGGIDSGG